MWLCYPILDICPMPCVTQPLKFFKGRKATCVGMAALGRQVVDPTLSVTDMVKCLTQV